MKNTFRLYCTFFCTLFCILTIPSAPARAAGAIVWDFTTYTEEVTLNKTNKTFYATDGKTGMVYVGGEKCAIVQGDNKAYCLKMGGATSNNARTFVLRVTGAGTLSIETNGSNIGTWTGKEGGSTGTQLFTGYKGYDGTAASPVITSTKEITVTGSLYLETSDKAYISKITWTTSEAEKSSYVIDIYNSNANHSGSGYQLPFYVYYQGNGYTEYIIKNYEIPDIPTNSENIYPQFWVGYEKWTDGKSANAYVWNIPLLANKKSIGKAPGAVGDLHIWSNSKDKNYGIHFSPAGYGLCWGVSGSKNWDNSNYKAFAKSSTYENTHTWETGLVQISNTIRTGWSYNVSYKGNDENPWYVYSNTITIGDNMTISGRSSTDALSSMKVLDANGTFDSGKTMSSLPDNQYGKFRIYDNSGDNNWYCHFVPYYRVAYDEQEGSEVEDGEYYAINAGVQSITLPTPTRDGYVFKGWSYENNTYTNTYSFNPTADITLTAQWEKVYTVTYNLNGGNGTAPTQEALRNGEQFTIASADGITKEGYTFAGWNDGTTTYQPGEMYTISTTNVILTAQWETKWTLRGSFENGGWGTDHDFVATEEEGIATYTISLAASTTYEFKVYGDATWYGLLGNGNYKNTFSCVLNNTNQINDNVIFTTTIAGDYLFTLDTKSNDDYPTISVTYPAEPTPCFSMKVTATSGSINGQTELTNKHANIIGGTVFYARSSDNTKIEKNGFLFGSDADSLRVTLADGALLAKNTTIKLTFTTNGTKRGIKLLAKDRKTEIVSITSPIEGTTTDTVVTIKSDIETDVFYIVRATGNNTYLKSIELSGCGMLCVSPQLAWSAKTAEGMLGGSITLPTLNNPGRLAGITYTSDNPKVATVDEAGNVSILAVGATDISATYAGNETYCEQTVTYTLTVQCAVAPTIQPTEGVISGCNGSVTLTASPSDNSTYSGGAFQWYHNGKAIQGAAASTYTATAIGTYTVAYISTSGCSEMSTNSATITGEGTQPEVTCLTPFHYYRKGCEYTSKNDNPVRHLFKVVSTNTASDGKTWMPYARKISGSTQADMSNVTEWISANATNDTILLNMQTFAEKAGGSLSVGDTVVISVRPVDVCGNFSEAAEESIRLIVTEKDTRAVAYIVSGGNGNTITYGGDFLTGYNPNDLLAMNGYTSGKTSWSTDPDPLWYMLDTCKTYIATAVNGYAPFNKYNYEPFDIILLTDFPKTDKNVNGQTGAPYLNDLAELVDSKPFLTLKAHMAKNGMDKWKALGFKATPLVPTSTQLTLDLICSQHTIFDRVYGDIQVLNTTDADGQLQLLKAGGYDSGKGLQGFMARDMVGFMNIATIPYRNGSSDTLLVACCERQTNLDARLMVLSINAQAMSQLNAIGGNTLLSMLDYLLIDDYARVEDCGCIFDNNGGKGDGKWSTTTNWQNRKLPQRATTAHIHANCVVDQMDAVVGELKIWNEATLTINADAALQVSDRIGYCDKENRLRIYPISSASTIRIQADANGAGTLIHSASPDWELPATVAYYSIASGAPTDCKWQWMTTPIHDMQGVGQYFYGAWLYEWSNEVHQWNKYLRNGDSMRPFNGYSLTQKTSGTTYTIAGNLVYAQDTTIALGYDNANADGCNLIGNSWTAPINISGFDEESDFKNCEATIILFNTGLDPDGIGKNGSAAGQYVSVPVNTASTLEKAMQVIPAMQTFQVNATGEGASVQLRYNSLVRTYSSKGINRQPMRVAARNNYEGEGITDRLHIRVDGERFSDHVYLFRNADCTYGFDNGWDGTKMLGDERAVQLFAEQGENQWAVSTQPSLAGTQLGFYRGEDDTYTMYFDYEGSEVLYLYDNETQRYTLVESGATYTFSSFTYDLEHRFLLTDFNPETPSGPTTDIANIIVSSDQLSISHTGSEPLTISVYDAAGHTCLRLQTDAPMTAIPLPDTQGVYLIEVQSASARITQKVVR